MLLLLGIVKGVAAVVVVLLGFGDDDGVDRRESGRSREEVDREKRVKRVGMLSCVLEWSSKGR